MLYPKTVRGWFGAKKRRSGSGEGSSLASGAVEVPTRCEALAMRAVAPFFDCGFYLDRNPDVARAGCDPLLHFVRFGDGECRDPSGDFCTRAYRLRYPDVARTGVNALLHYVQVGREANHLIDVVDSGRWCDMHSFELDVMRPEFDAGSYLASNPDVEGCDPLYHFAKFGWLEGRDPNRTFSVAGYSSRYDDVRTAGINPFFHFLVEGRKEGRSAVREAGDLSFEQETMRNGFDEAFYRGHLPDGALDNFGGENAALRHFTTVGWKTGLDPNRDFSVSGYLSIYEDVKSAGVNPYYHWLVEGCREGRLAKAHVDYRCRVIAALKPPQQRLEEASLRSSPPDMPCADIRVLLASLFEAPFAITVSHDDYSAHVGGVQLLIRSEAAGLRRHGIAHLHLHPVHDLLQVVEAGDPTLGLVLDGRSVGHIRGSGLEEAVSAVCADASPRRAAPRCVSFTVHSLLGHRVETLVALARTVAASSLRFWVHDYAAVCAGLRLMRNDVEWCGAPIPESTACRVCIHASHRAIHSAAHETLLRALPFDVLAPSRTAADLFAAHHTYVSCRVRPHLDLVPREAARRRPGALRVAFLGHPAVHKGWFDFLQIAATLHRPEAVRFFLISTGSEAPPGIEKVEAVPTTDGASAMSSLVESHSIDFAVVASLWKETFCLTAYEAVAGGARLLTYDVSGNVCELARAGHGEVFQKPDEIRLFLEERIERDDVPQWRMLYDAVGHGTDHLGVGGTGQAVSRGPVQHLEPSPSRSDRPPDGGEEVFTLRS